MAKKKRKKQTNKKRSRYKIVILIIFSVLIFITLLALCMYKKNKSYPNSLEMNVHIKDTLSILEPPNLTTLSYYVSNNNAKDYKKLDIVVICYANGYFSGRGNLHFTDVIGNSSTTGTMRATKIGPEPDYCVITDYSTEDYTFFEWIDLILRKIKDGKL